MLEIILVIGSAVAFYNLAKNNGLTAWVWAVLAIVGYLGGAFIVGLIIGLVAPELLEDQIILTLLGLAAGGIGILIIYLILRMKIKQKESEISDAEVLDNEF